MRISRRRAKYTRQGHVATIREGNHKSINVRRSPMYSPSPGQQRNRYTIPIYLQVLCVRHSPMSKISPRGMHQVHQQRMRQKSGFVWVYKEQVHRNSREWLQVRCNTWLGSNTDTIMFGESWAGLSTPRPSWWWVPKGTRIILASDSQIWDKKGNFQHQTARIGAKRSDF